MSAGLVSETACECGVSLTRSRSARDSRSRESRSIWNDSRVNGFLNVARGTATGSLSQIAFYSDAGQTYLGEGGFAG